MEELFLQTGFGRVFAKATGASTAPPVLAIHGWSQRNGWHTWEPLMSPLAANGYRVVSIDMPGWGKSVSEKPGSLSVDDAVTTVLELLDGLHTETAVLMGKSWGGGVAISLALLHPARATKLILTAPAYRDLNSLSRLTQPVLLAWAKDDPVIPYEYARQFADAIPDCSLESYDTGGHSAAAENAEAFNPIVVDFLKE